MPELSRPAVSARCLTPRRSLSGPIASRLRLTSSFLPITSCRFHTRAPVRHAMASIDGQRRNLETGGVRTQKPA